MARVGAELAEIVVFVGAHPVGEGFRGVFLQKSDPLNVVQDLKGLDQ